MGKKSKKDKKRAERRERARRREASEDTEEQIQSQEAAADELVDISAKAAPVEPPAREKRAPRPPREADHDNAWERLKAFLREVNIERMKINWPAVDETWRSTWVTVFVILFLSAFMGLASYGLKNVTERLFSVDTGVVQPANIPTSPLGGALNPALPETEETPTETGGTTEVPSEE